MCSQTGAGLPGLWPPVRSALPRALGQDLLVSCGELLHFSAPRARTVWGGAWARRPEQRDPLHPLLGALLLLQRPQGFTLLKSLGRCPAPASLHSLPCVPTQSSARPLPAGLPLSLSGPPSELRPQSTGLDSQPHKLCASGSSPTGDSESPPRWVGGDSTNTHGISLRNFSAYWPQNLLVSISSSGK